MLYRSIGILSKCARIWSSPWKLDSLTMKLKSFDGNYRLTASLKCRSTRIQSVEYFCLQLDKNDPYNTIVKYLPIWIHSWNIFRKKRATNSNISVLYLGLDMKLQLGSYSNLHRGYCYGCWFLLLSLSRYPHISFYNYIIHFMRKVATA